MTDHIDLKSNTDIAERRLETVFAMTLENWIAKIEEVKDTFGGLELVITKLPEGTDGL